METVFLKLGGSLITDKSRARTPRRAVIRRLSGEIARARRETPGMRLVLGHGSGSFGHPEAKKYGTADGVRTAADWRGFAEVWAAADQLNRIIMDSLSSAGVGAVRIAPSSCMILDSGRIAQMPVAPVESALDAGLVPVVYGDAVFDRARGGGIASTEMIFARLARALRPRRILLAGIERGVFEDYPERKQLLERIRTGDRERLLPALQGSAHADVTGGMISKVLAMLDLTRDDAELQILVFSGKREDNVRRALAGEAVEGTILER